MRRLLLVLAMLAGCRGGGDDGDVPYVDPDDDSPSAKDFFVPLSSAFCDVGVRCETIPNEYASTQAECVSVDVAYRCDLFTEASGYQCAQEVPESQRDEFAELADTINACIAALADWPCESWYDDIVPAECVF